MKEFPIIAILTGVITACGGSVTPETPATDGAPPVAEITGTETSGDPRTGTAPAGASARADARAAAAAHKAEALERAATPVDRELTIPAGTRLRIALTNGVASDKSRVEDTVRGELLDAVTIDGLTVLPANTTLDGVVTEAIDSGRVKGRARLAFRFTSLRAGDRYDIRTEPIARIAPATKGEDATKIAIGAGAGAAIGGIVGGKKGAATGAAVGGGAGTGVVLATKGEEVRLAPGDVVSTRLTAPLTVRVRVDR